MYPPVSELAVDGIPVVVSCRVLGLARQPYYRWLDTPIADSQLDEAYLANAIHHAHRDDPEFGHRLLADEARGTGCSYDSQRIWTSSACAEGAVSDHPLRCPPDMGQWARSP